MNMYGNGEKKKERKKRVGEKVELPENGTVRNPAVITCIYIYVRRE